MKVPTDSDRHTQQNQKKKKILVECFHSGQTEAFFTTTLLIPTSLPNQLPKKFSWYTADLSLDRWFTVQLIKNMLLASICTVTLKVGRRTNADLLFLRFNLYKNSRINCTKSPASGVGKVSEPGLTSQVGRLRISCTRTSVFLSQSERWKSQ